jgi:hypothetical protein
MYILSTKKKLEYVAKRVVFGPTISAVPPVDYGNRFYEFMEKIFEEPRQSIPNASMRESKVILKK